MWQLLALMIHATTVNLKPILNLEPIPTEKEQYLQFTLHVEIDFSGNFYIPDYPSGKIFFWDQTGKFQGSFGQKGEGPGEFTFAASLGGPRGYIYFVEDRIYVYDGGNRTLSEFDENRRFIQRIILQGLGGMINNCQVPAKNRFVFYDSYFCEDTACRRIDIYNGKGIVSKEIIHDPDKTWSRDEAHNRVNLYIFEPTLAMDYSSLRKELAYAQTSQPYLNIMDDQGTLKRKIKLEIPKVMVQREDIDEFHAQDWMKGNAGIKAIFPTEKAYFDRILTLKEGYLVFHMSPLYRKTRGYLLDFEGKMQGKFSIDCGEGGGLYDPRDRLIAVVVDDQGDFQIQEMALK